MVFYRLKMRLFIQRAESVANNESARMVIIDSMNKEITRLSDRPDWMFDLLDVYLAETNRVAKLYKLDTYPHQIEVIIFDR